MLNNCYGLGDFAIQGRDWQVSQHRRQGAFIHLFGKGKLMASWITYVAAQALLREPGDDDLVTV